MMWPRLCLLRELLAETGSIWVTLDDNEIHRARMLMDEVFGEDHFVTQLVWQKRTSRENRATFSEAHDHILVYSKGQTEIWKTIRNLLDPGEAGYANPDNDSRGEWASIPFSAQGHRDNQMYEIKTPSGRVVTPPRGRCWAATQPVFEQLKADNLVYFPRDGDGLPRIKQFKDGAKGLVPSTLWLAADVGDNEDSKKEILTIFNENQPFDTPKPVRLVENVIQIATKPNPLILDSFAGSGTTAHAVLAANAKDGGQRRFILIECEAYADTLTARHRRLRLHRHVAHRPFHREADVDGLQARAGAARKSGEHRRAGGRGFRQREEGNQRRRAHRDR
jgi:adenine-specific DNA-methyltransferase